MEFRLRLPEKKTPVPLVGKLYQNIFKKFILSERKTTSPTRKNKTIANKKKCTTFGPFTRLRK